MDINAFKMDGLGNDFVIIDNRQKITDLTKDQIIKICDRNFIGCDQLIFFSFEIKSATHLVPFPHAPDSPPSELKNLKLASAELSDSIKIS